MRFLLILSTLALLPVFVGLHAWRFVRYQQPALEAAATAILHQEGIRAAAAELRYLDLRVTGDALDPQSLDRATAALERLTPTRLVSNELSVPGGLQAILQGDVLRLAGWLSDQASADRITTRFHTLRPDLKIDASALRISPHVRWPEGVTDPLAEDGPLLAGILEKLRVSPSLRIAVTDKAFELSGTLPSEQVRDSIVRVLRQVAPELAVNASAILISPHMRMARFAEVGALEPFLRSFYGTSARGTFALSADAGPRLQAAATPALQAEWLRLLREIVGGAKVDMDVTLYPSIYHFPGYKPVTPLPAETLENLRRTVSDFYITFDPNSSSLSAASAIRLAGLASSLLGAGPALHLVVGAHPDPGGEVAAQRRLAQARAEQVRSYLIEQGAPAAEIEAIAFDPVPPGTPGAPLQARSVEILIK